MEDNVQTGEELSEILRVRREKLESLRETGSDPFLLTRFDKTHSSAQVTAAFDTLEGQTVRIAGRIMSKRLMGKACFAHIQDEAGLLQLYVRLDAMGEEPYALFKKNGHRRHHRRGRRSIQDQRG